MLVRQVCSVWKIYRAAYSWYVFLSLCVSSWNSHRRKSTEGLLVGQNITRKRWRPRFGAVGPSMPPKSATKLEWAHLAVATKHQPLSFALQILHLGHTNHYLTFGYRCICLFSVSSNRMWAHCWPLVGTQENLPSAIALFIAEQGSPSHGCLFSSDILSVRIQSSLAVPGTHLFFQAVSLPYFFPDSSALTFKFWSYPAIWFPVISSSWWESCPTVTPVCSQRKHVTSWGKWQGRGWMEMRTCPSVKEWRGDSPGPWPKETAQTPSMLISLSRPLTLCHSFVEPAGESNSGLLPFHHTLCHLGYFQKKSQGCYALPTSFEPHLSPTPKQGTCPPWPVLAPQRLCWAACMVALGDGDQDLRSKDGCPWLILVDGKVERVGCPLSFYLEFSHFYWSHLNSTQQQKVRELFRVSTCKILSYVSAFHSWIGVDGLGVVVADKAQKASVPLSWEKRNRKPGWFPSTALQVARNASDFLSTSISSLQQTNCFSLPDGHFHWKFLMVSQTQHS